MSNPITDESQRPKQISLHFKPALKARLLHESAIQGRSLNNQVVYMLNQGLDKAETGQAD